MGDHIGLYLKKISEAIDRRLNARAREYGLTLTQCRVLLFLYEKQGEIVTQRDVEVLLGATHATVSGIISRLRQNGFVDVSPHPTDRRAKCVSLGMDKECLFAHADRVRDEVTGMLCANLSEEQISALEESLGIVYENVK